MAARYRQELNPGIIGVTGSAGKTSVKELTAHMLAQARPTAKSLGNWNNDIGIPLSLLAMPGDTQAAVFEVGTNHPGEIASLCDLLKPGDGILTNIGAAHIENFGSIEAIAEEKSALLKCLSPIGIAVLDAESEYFDQLAAAVPGRVVTVAKQGNADYTILARDEQLREVEIGEQETGEKISIPIDPFSEYQVSNVMLSVAMARAHQVDWEQIRQAVEEYQPLPMRWQREWVREVLMINDAYNANPLNMRAAIDAFRDEQHQGAKWLVLGEMQELGDHARTEHRMLGEYLASGTWSGLIVVGNGAAGIGDGAASAGMERGAIYHCEDSAAAAETLGAALSPGDAVMVKGSRGARMESVITEFKQGD